MSRLEQIIFIADYIEPRRFKAPDLPEVRKVAFHDLDECCYIILRDSVKYLRSKGGRIDEMTEQAFCYYEKLHMEKNGVIYSEKNGEKKQFIYCIPEDKVWN